VPTQELELANRYISTLDALLASAPSPGIGRHLAAAAALAGNGSLDRGSPSAIAAATAAAAAAASAASDPVAAGSLGGLYSGLGLGSAALDAHIRRTLEGQAARAEAAEVSVQPSCCRAACRPYQAYAGDTDNKTTVHIARPQDRPGARANVCMTHTLLWQLAVALVGKCAWDQGISPTLSCSLCCHGPHAFLERHRWTLRCWP